MNKTTVLGMKLGEKLTSLALKMGVASTRAACVSIFYQPKMPSGMNEFVERKDKNESNCRVANKSCQ